MIMAKAEEIFWFLDSAHTAEVLWTIGLAMSYGATDVTNEVFKGGVGHWGVREESFIRSGNSRGIFKTFFLWMIRKIDFQVFKDMGRRRK